jgi:Fe-S cluster assembly iron-binding protein IscA
VNLDLSPEAAQHLKTDLNGRILRIAFTTGCGGSGYRLATASEPVDGDHVVEVDGIQIALDDMAASRLDGAVIVYDPDEEGYTLDHPDAVTAVWCG